MNTFSYYRPTLGTARFRCYDGCVNWTALIANDGKIYQWRSDGPDSFSMEHSELLAIFRINELLAMGVGAEIERKGLSVARRS